MKNPRPLLRQTGTIPGLGTIISLITISILVTIFILVARVTASDKKGKSCTDARYTF